MSVAGNRRKTSSETRRAPELGGNGIGGDTTGADVAGLGETGIDATGWHSQISRRFDERYSVSKPFIERLKIWTELIAKYGSADSFVLDAGCGSGVFSFVAAQRCASVLGFDGSAEMIALCRDKQREKSVDNIEFSPMRLESLNDLSESHYDLILCSSVLEYVDDFWTAIEDLKARLKPGAVLVFSVPNRSSIYRRIERVFHAATGRPRYYAFVNLVPTDASITQGLQARSMEVLDKHYYAPTPVLSAMFRRLKASRWSDNLIVYSCRARDPSGI